MKIGYPCINNSVSCRGNKTFKLASYSEEKLVETVTNNLNCLKKMLEYNVEHNFLFFRISSDLVPFASHQICTFNWQEHFKKTFEEVGEFIKQHNMRISMHPDQFVLINSPDTGIVERSIAELAYHADVLNLMNLDTSAKIQIHVGGVYGDKPAAINRFIENYKTLPKKIQQRLAIENDDKLYSLKDCLTIAKEIPIPIIFDFFHHECLNNNETFPQAVKQAADTWKKEDGILMTDYSSQAEGERKGKHTKSIDESHFKSVIETVPKTDFDIILEIKDKETSTLKAFKILKSLKRI